MKLYGGIDLHSNNSLSSVIDEADRVVYERRLANDLELLLLRLADYREALEGIVVESTYNWYWLVDGLQAAGYRVHLANPAAIRQYAGLKYTDDAHDARWLAHLLRLGILPEGYIYPKEARALRDLLRTRSQLVRQQVAQILSIQNLMIRNTGHELSAKMIKQLQDEAVEAQLGDANRAEAVKSSLRVGRCLEEEIALVEHQVKAQVKLQPPFQRLLTITGMGTMLALTISLETGDIDRLAHIGF